jgi:segregation and condensation protein B
MEIQNDFSKNDELESEITEIIEEKKEDSTISENSEENKSFKEKVNYKPIIEAILFVSGNSVSFEKLKKIIELTLDELREIIDEINIEYEENDHSLKIIEVASGFQIVTRSEYSDWIRKFFGKKKIRHLPPSLLEVLSIIAYQQPITKAKIEHVRGVSCDVQLQNLMEKQMIQILGRAEELGRPKLYGTTKEFLEYFGLNNLKDLPDIKELNEILEEKKEEQGEKVDKVLVEIGEKEPVTDENDEELKEKNNNGEIQINKKERDDEDDMLDKEFQDILKKDKNIRKQAQMTLEKLNEPEEFKNYMAEVNEQKLETKSENVELIEYDDDSDEIEIVEENKDKSENSEV